MTERRTAFWSPIRNRWPGTCSIGSTPEPRRPAQAPTSTHFEQQDSNAVFSAGAQQDSLALSESAGTFEAPCSKTGVSSPYTGMLPRVWNVSHAIPVGSVTQYLSARE